MTHTFEAAPPRLGLAALLAAPMVYLLFHGANALITVDNLVLKESTQRELTPITPAEPTALEPDQMKPLPPVLLDKPPPLPRDTVSTTGSAPVFDFAPPETGDLVTASFAPPAVDVSPVAGRNIQVVRSPAPSVPPAALSRGISGDCTVLFDVDRAGRPFNITARCTDDVFRAEAIRAVSKAEFLPKVNARGIPVEQHGAIYPLEFRIE
jgi:protein TonB